ncbi:MAG: hypothetical protein GY778_03960 [bacterium]|nr:hypothetical protein [bacterium]
MTICIYDLTHTLNYDRADAVQAARAWDEVHAVSTLQGIVNRKAPRLYVRFVEHQGRNIDDWWLEQLSQPGRWLAGAERRPIGSLEELVDVFRDDVAGAVVYDPGVPATSNVASSLAGVEDLVAVRRDRSRGSVYDRLVTRGPRLPVKRRLVGDDGGPLFTGTDQRSCGSAKCDAYLWAKDELIDTGRCNPAVLAYYIDSYWIDHAGRSVPNHHTLTNHDYFVAVRAFFCDLHCWGDEKPVDDPQQPLGADLSTFQTILRALYDRNSGTICHVGGFTPWAFKYTDHPGAGGGHWAVGTEWELVRVVSAYNGFLDADAIGYGAMANASFFMHFPLEARYKQNDWPTTAELRAAGYVNRRGQPTDADRDFVMFYVGDFDSAAWLYQRMPDLWNDPNRGQVPLSWAISPALCRRAPMVMDYLWRTRTTNDSFIAADNGAGYLNPCVLTEPRPVSGLPSGVNAWAEHCRRLYEQWDLSVTGFVIDGHAGLMADEVLDAYADFSPNGVVPQHYDVPLRLHRNMPVLLRGPDVVEDEPSDAIAGMVQSIAENRRRGLRFHWFRTILKNPTWHARVTDALRRADSRIEVVGAPVFFEMLRRGLATRA